MRAAIYARYSSENQRETSIDDQTRLCRERAEREGWDVVATFGDREISAATPMSKRPGGRAMLAAAVKGFDVLVIEALDRCWRDIVDQENTLRRLEFAGIRIVGVSDGYDSLHEDRELQRGFRGLLNQQYIRDLAKKTHRGQTGQVLRGYNAGGMPYGYRPVRDEHGSRLQVHEPQAAWVRWIFERYAEGWSVQRIAYGLNEQRAPASRGGTWAVSAIYGSRGKGTGILNNQIYAGRYIWNRSRWVKDPETNARKRFERPANEWRTSEHPELRIVAEPLWKAVRARMDAPRAHPPGRPTSTLFGGLLRCGICGGAMVAINKHLYGCAAAKDRGPTVCAGITTPRRDTDARLLSVVRTELLTPEAVTYFQSALQELLREAAREDPADAADQRRRRSELTAEVARLVEAIAEVGISPALSARLRDAEAALALLKRNAAMSPPRPEAVMRDAVATYRKMVLRLQDELSGSIVEARQALAEMFGDIRVQREGDEIYADFPPLAERFLLYAAAGGRGFVDNSGSGGPLPELSTIRIRIK